MDHLKIIKRAAQITWEYRTLWIFGFLVALGAGGGGSPGNTGGSTNWNVPRDQANNLFPQNFQFPNLEPYLPAIIVGVILLVCLFIIIGIAFTILKYLGRSALIQMVNQFEEDNTHLNIRQGFKFAWNRKTWRLFLIDLLMLIPGIALVLILMLSFSPLLLWLFDNRTIGILGTIATIGLVLLTVFIAVIIASALRVLVNFFYRAALLDDKGVISAIQYGFSMVKDNLLDTLIMALILLGINLALILLTIPGLIIIIPITLIFLAVGVIIGAIPALITGGIMALFLNGAAPWIMGGLIGLPIVIIFVSLPFAFIRGLIETFFSSAWTLTYREFKSLNKLEITE